MPKKEREFTVPKKGTGRPDFTQKIEDIARGYVYGQFKPGLKERWKIFLAAYPVGSELPAGETQNFLDIETYLPASPYTSPVGWYLRFAAAKSTFDQTVRVELLMGQKLIIPLPKITFLPPVQDVFARNEQIPYLDTRYWDPQAVDKHEITLSITNTSAVDAVGFAEVTLIMEEVGTPEITEKQIKCPICGHIQTVPVKQTKIACPNCGQIFIVPWYGPGVRGETTPMPEDAVLIDLPKGLKKKLDKEAKGRGMLMSQLVRLALNEWVEKGKGKP